MSLYVALFLAGLLTILLPCILPLVPIVLGVSIAGRNPWRPFLTVAGMVVSFVGFTLLLNIVLSQFVEAALIIQDATIYILFLFGAGFLFHSRSLLHLFALGGALFFIDLSVTSTIIAAILGSIAVEVGGRIASRLQQTGVHLQQGAIAHFGEQSLLTPFVIGMTLGLIWVPCAGPALSFAFTLVRTNPGVHAALALFMYAAGTAVPLLIVGYGGQRAVRSFRALTPYAGRIKQISGAVLLITAIGLHQRWFEHAQVWLLDHTGIGDFGARLEERYFGGTFEDAQRSIYASSSSMAPTALKPMPSSASSAMPVDNLPMLPKISRAPELAGLGKWFNSEPLTMASLKGKVVLIDFWTYSCINCIRTLPYLKQYWTSYKDTGKFILLGIHAPEFVFEKSAENVQAAIDRHELTYPIAQDNDFVTWRAFANRYWPAKYLIDAEGYIRYTHFGEGDYDETDRAIRSLLKEAGADLVPTAIEDDQPGRRTAMTSETYLGERSWPALGNAQGDPSDAVESYGIPESTQLHRYYLVGDWQLLDGERQVTRAPADEIRMRFLGGEINLVLGLEDGAAPAKGTVFIDGTKVKDIAIDHDDLYTLFSGPTGEHELKLQIFGTGVEAYAFTFGAGE